MNAERWRQVRQILDSLDNCENYATGDRAAQIAASCNGDPELRREVESLLAFETRADALERASNRSAAPAPDHIGPYRIERILGAGGMGSVFLAVRADDQYLKRVAIKVIQWAGDPETASRFRTERQVLASLDHPHIARLLDGGTLPDGRPYLVMDYIDGVPVDVFVRREKLPVDSVLQLFLKVCAAVQFAHRNLVVHRDLKSGNILVSADGEPHLLDFGIAKLLNAAGPEMDRTQAWQRLLTPASASPEQASGGTITTASDVYSLGVLLYGLVAANGYYAGAKDFAANPGRAICEYEPPPLRHVRGDVDIIVRKATAKDPARRYPTVEELAADLRRYLGGHPIAARPSSFLYRAARFARRNRLLVLSTAGLVFAIAAGLAGTALYAYRARVAEVRAERRFDALHRLTNSMLFEVDDAIANLQGATAAREAIVRRALEYLDQLSADSGDNPAVLRDLALAYRRIGTIQGTEQSAHLGGTGSMENARKSYLKSLAIAQRLVAGDPGNLDLQLEILEPESEIAEFYRYQGDLDRALSLDRDLVEKAKAVASRAARTSKQFAESQYKLGTFLTMLGATTIALGDPAKALDHLREGLAVREALLARNPGDKRALRAIGIAHNYLCVAFEAASRYNEAAEQASLSLAARAPLAAGDPRNNEFHDFLADANRHLCLDLAHIQNFGQALPHCKAAVDLYRDGVTTDPENAQATENLALAFSAMSDAMDLDRRTADALGWEAKSRALYATIATKDPDSLQAATEDVSSLLHFASLENTLGRRAAAVKDLSAARGMLEGQLRRSPKNRVVNDLIVRANAVTAGP